MCRIPLGNLGAKVLSQTAVVLRFRLFNPRREDRGPTSVTRGVPLRSRRVRQVSAAKGAMSVTPV
jgi:hypothetical protein